MGPQAGEAQIHVSARDDSSSLLPITARQNALFPGTAEAGTATIRVARLADEVPAADIASGRSRRGRRSYRGVCRRPAPGPMGWRAASASIAAGRRSYGEGVRHRGRSRRGRRSYRGACRRPAPGPMGCERHRGRSRRGRRSYGVGVRHRGRSRRGRRSYRGACRRPALGPMGGRAASRGDRGGGAAPTTERL